MAVKIKLVRFGRKKKPIYRIVVAEERSKVTGRVVETLGYYIPDAKTPKINVKQDRLRNWMEKGSQPTEAVRKLLNL